MSDGHQISTEDLALYAMSSLDPAEHARIKAELAASPSSYHSLSEVTGSLAVLGLSVEELPLPAGARERFLKLIEAEPRSAAAGAVIEWRDPAELPRSGAAQPIAGSRTLPFAAPVQPPAPRKPLLTALPWMLAAAMLIAAIYLGSQVSELRASRDQARNEALKLAVDADQTSELRTSRDNARAQAERLAAQAARAEQVLEVLTAPTAQHVTLTEGKPTPAPTGHTSYLPSRGALVFVANNLRPLAPGKVYELWVLPASGQPPLAAGTFHPDARGTASVVLPKLPVGIAAKGFGVTIERAEGSATPTLPIVLSGS